MEYYLVDLPISCPARSLALSNCYDPPINSQSEVLLFLVRCLPISCSVRSFTLSAQIHQSISPITLISGSSTNSMGIFQALSNWEIVLYLNRDCVIQSCKGLPLSVKLIQSYSDRQRRIIILSPGKINTSSVF
jgi:hypothetical protein